MNGDPAARGLSPPAGLLALDAAAVAEQAFVLGYPLVLADRTMAQATAVAAPDPESMRAPVNTLVLARDTADTLRSSAWLDLAAGPVVLTVPDTRGRYYALWMRDAWNAVFTSLGARTTGTAPQTYGVLGPAQHHVRLPPGLTPLASPTCIVHVAGCVEAVGERGDETLRWARERFVLRPLSGGQRPLHAVASPADLAPVELVERMDARAFFSEVLRLASDNPPDLAGRALLDRLRQLTATPARHADLERGLRRGRAAIRAAAQRPPAETVEHWRIDYGCGGFGTDRVRRAGAARAGLGTDPSADALPLLLDRDADGRPLTGGSRYLLRFAPEGTPPVHGFWSLTACDAETRYSTGDLQGLALDIDGSLPIHIQHAPPARKRRSNWLPSPRGRFSIALKLYWPAEQALRHEWSPPAVTRVD